MLWNCECKIVLEPAELLAQPVSPQLASEDELQQAGEHAVRHLWDGEMDNVPGSKEWFAKKGGRDGGAGDDGLRVGVKLESRDFEGLG